VFKVGKIYKRKEDIHIPLGGQRQGGISTPAKHPIVLLFTGDTGVEYGYEDRFQGDGTFWYTGEGQVGDMEMLRGNAAIRDHAKNGKRLHLFEYVEKGKVRYIGEARYLDYHSATRPDQRGSLRNAFVFQLELLPEDGGMPLDKLEKGRAKPLKKMSLAELRVLARSKTPAEAPIKQAVQTIYMRSEAVKLYALKRSKGICEACEQPAPFEGKLGPFLEVHHLHRLGDGGPDEPSNVAAICPNCHRRAHFSKDGAEFNKFLITRIFEREAAFKE